MGLPAVIGHGEFNWVHHWLVGESSSGPVAEIAYSHHVSAGIEWGLIALGSAIALVGVWFGWTRYSRHGLAYDDQVTSAFGKLYSVFSHKYYWDEFYDKYVVQAIVKLADKFATFDSEVVDGSVDGLADVVQASAGRLRKTQTGVVQAYAAGIVLGVAIVVGLFIMLT